jgi:hypothetical protein
MPKSQPGFEKQVFVNCPFDDEYRPLLRALLFTVLDCGLVPRLASDRADSGEARVEKIRSLIRSCRLSIHDLSRMEPLRSGDLPRFNMSFELGLDLGCRFFGAGAFSTKQCLILEKDRFRYRQALSDISGNDIRAHEGEPETLTMEVRNWLRVATQKDLPSGSQIWRRYHEFTEYLEERLKASGFTEDEIESLEVPELLQRAREWIGTSASEEEPDRGA